MTLPDPTVAGLEASVSVVVEIVTPPVWQLVVPAASGPHRLNLTVPLNWGTPNTLIVAESLLVTWALAGITVLEPASGVGVVVVVERHSPSEPRAKSNSVAVRDCEERVSPTKVLKHLPARPVSVRLMPPS